MEKPNLHDWYRFESIEQRDRCLNEWFPQRKCSDAPGVYDIPGGQQLVVVYLDVKVFDNA